MGGVVARHLLHRGVDCLRRLLVQLHLHPHQIVVQLRPRPLVLRALLIAGANGRGDLAGLVKGLGLRVDVDELDDLPEKACLGRLYARSALAKETTCGLAKKPADALAKEAAEGGQRIGARQQRLGLLEHLQLGGAGRDADDVGECLHRMHVHRAVRACHAICASAIADVPLRYVVLVDVVAKLFDHARDERVLVIFVREKLGGGASSADGEVAECRRVVVACLTHARCRVQLPLLCHILSRVLDMLVADDTRSCDGGPPVIGGVADAHGHRAHQGAAELGVCRLGRPAFGDETTRIGLAGVAAGADGEYRHLVATNAVRLGSLARLRMHVVLDAAIRAGGDATDTIPRHRCAALLADDSLHGDLQPRWIAASYTRGGHGMNACLCNRYERRAAMSAIRRGGGISLTKGVPLGS